MRDFFEEQIAKLDRALFNEIMPDIINGSIWSMDDETLEMILTGIWESSEWNNSWIVEQHIQIGHA